MKFWDERLSDVKISMIIIRTFLALILLRVEATKRTERRFENNRAHFGAFSPVSVNSFYRGDPSTFLYIRWVTGLWAHLAKFGGGIFWPKPFSSETFERVGGDTGLPEMCFDPPVKNWKTFSAHIPDAVSTQQNSNDQ